MMKKYFLAGVMVLMLAVVFAGCSTNDERIDNDEIINNDTESTEEEVTKWANAATFISETANTLSDYFTIDSDIQNEEDGILLYITTNGGSGDVDVIMNYASVIGLLVNKSYADNLLESNEEIKLITMTVDTDAWYVFLSKSGSSYPPFFSSLVITDAFQQSDPVAAQEIQDAYNEYLGDYDLFSYTNTGE